MRGAIHIDSNKINNERIFIPDLYSQISQIAADFILSSRASREWSGWEAVTSRGRPEAERKGNERIKSPGITETYRHGIPRLRSE